MRERKRGRASEDTPEKNPPEDDRECAQQPEKNMKAHCFTAENCCNDFVAAVAVLEAAVNLLATSLSLQFLLTKETIYLKARVVMVAMMVVLQAHLISSPLSWAG